MRPRATDVGLDAKCPATARESLQPRIGYICNSSRSSDEPRGNEACNPSPTNSSLSAGDRYSHALFLNIGTGNVWGSPEFISCCRFPSPLPVGAGSGLVTGVLGCQPSRGGSPLFTLYMAKHGIRVTPARQATEYSPYRPGHRNAERSKPSPRIFGKRHGTPEACGCGDNRRAGSPFIEIL